MACVLTDMLKIRMLNENRQMPITRGKIVGEKPTNARDIALIPQATASGIRLSKRDTSQPDMGRPINELTGIAKSSVASSASMKTKKVLIVGIREGRVEKLNPDIKKNILRKILCLFSEVIPNI